jgi:hypothetical protein
LWTQAHYQNHYAGEELSQTSRRLLLALLHPLASQRFPYRLPGFVPALITDGGS